MKKTSKKTTTVVEETVETPSTPVAQETIVPQANVPAEAVAEVTTKQLGRPIVPGSKRQLAIEERNRKIAAGELKRGRKIKEGSKRQMHLAHLAEMKEKGLLTGKKGRPVVPGSKHQEALAAKQARIANNGGIPLKPGRPKMIKQETEQEETVDVS